MGMKYVKAYYDWITVMEPLDDAERGRLMTAALIYANTGELVPLSGAEKYVFPTIRLQIDRDRDGYEKKVETNRENGALGGRPKGKPKEAKKANAFSKTQSKATETRKSQDKDKDKDKEESAAVAADARDSGGPLLSDAEMDALAGDLNEVLNAAEDAGFPQTPADYDMGTLLVADYGTDAVLHAIRISVGRPADKRHWGYVKGVLEKDPAGKEFKAQEAQTVRPRFVNSGGSS